MRLYFVLKLDLKWISLLIALAYISHSPQSYILVHLLHNNNPIAISLETRVFTWCTTLSYTTLIVSCYYTQLEQLGAIKCKGDGSARSGSCSHHIFKNIWSPAVHKGLHYHSNFNVPYIVVVLKKCLCLLYCLIRCSVCELKKPQPCTIQVHHSSARYLYSDSVSATMYVQVSGQLAVKNWWGFRSGTKSPNRQIKTTSKFFDTARAGNWNLATGSSQLT